MIFDKVELWVQVWGLPTHCQTVSIGYKIGKYAGEVLNEAVFDMGGVNGRILKMLVCLHVNEPLRKGVNIGSKADGVFWVEFKYE